MGQTFVGGMKNNCKVITTCFVGRAVRQETAIDGYPPGLFEHSQNFPTPEKVLDLVAYIYELERKVDPGRTEPSASHS